MGALADACPWAAEPLAVEIHTARAAVERLHLTLPFGLTLALFVRTPFAISPLSPCCHAPVPARSTKPRCLDCGTAMAHAPLDWHDSFGQPLPAYVEQLLAASSLDPLEAVLAADLLTTRLEHVFTLLEGVATLEETPEDEADEAYISLHELYETVAALARKPLGA